jgi:hypothetical protein
MSEYTKYVLLRYRNHTNVVVCSGIKSVKYIYQYMTKGAEFIVAGIQSKYNQISEYLNYRYVSAP